MGLCFIRPQNDMKIAFVLPCISKSPGGGFKVVFQYANYFANKNEDVTIYYMTDRFLKGKFPNFLRRIIARICAPFFPRWFKLSSKIKCKSAFVPEDIQNSDVIIATAIMTVDFITHINNSKRKVYFIQGFETFYASEEEVYNSYKLPFDKIVISKWINKIIYDKTGQHAEYIPNGIDLDVFSSFNLLEKRENHSIAFHYRPADLKGCKYAFMTIEILKSQYEDLKVYIVGNVDKPDCVPDYCCYYQNITEEEVAQINNKSHVFLCTSIEEGFGLPGLEAMACGCCLATTNYLGALEYAIDEYNCLLSQPKNFIEMAENVKRFFEDEQLSCHISKNAILTAKEFDINLASQKFYNYICSK